MHKMTGKLKFLSGKNRLIGLDIGSYSLKLAEFVNRQRRLNLVNLKLQEIDSSTDKQEVQLNALKNLLRHINTKDAIINVVINCSQGCT